MDSKLIVTIDVYNSQVAETKKFEKRYKDEQEAKLDLQNKYDELEKKLQSQLRLQEAREDFKEPYVEDETEDIKESESSVVEAFPKSQQARVEETIRDVKATTSGIDTAKLKALLQDEDLIQLFNEASLDVIKGRYLQDDDHYDDLLFRDLIEISDRDSEEDVRYGFTRSGQYLRELILSQEETMM